jgi:hypothetical protein
VALGQVVVGQPVLDPKSAQVRGEMVPAAVGRAVAAQAACNFLPAVAVVPAGALERPTASMTVPAACRTVPAGVLERRAASMVQSSPAPTVSDAAAAVAVVEIEPPVDMVVWSESEAAVLELCWAGCKSAVRFRSVVGWSDAVPGSEVLRTAAAAAVVVVVAVAEAAAVAAQAAAGAARGCIQCPAPAH